MRRGEIAFLRRPKRFISCKVIETYNHFPAVRVRLSGKPDDFIVSTREIVSGDERNAAKLQEKKRDLTQKHSDIISRWRKGMTCAEWQAENGWNIGQWSAIRALKRLGVIS